MHKNRKAERKTFKALHLPKIMATRHPAQTDASLDALGLRPFERYK